MDCRTAWTLLPYAKPHAPELDAAEGLALHQHLEGCAACSSLAASEQALDGALGRAMRDVPVPDGLRERILRQLDENRNRRQRSRLLYATAALAAMVLLGVVFSRWPARLTSNNTHVDLDALTQRPLVGAPPRKADQVSDWFRNHHAVDVSLPADFERQWNFELIQSADVEPWGQYVIPVLVFRRDNDFAKVYLLQPGQYSPEQAVALQAQSPSYPGAPHVFGKPNANESIALVVLGGEKGEIRKFLHPTVLPRS